MYADHLALVCASGRSRLPRHRGPGPGCL